MRGRGKLTQRGANEAEKYGIEVRDAFYNALNFMGIDFPEERYWIIESWVRFFLTWRGRRVVGFDSPQDVGVKLLADSFAISYLQDDLSPENSLDVGSGNGWPGLSVKTLYDRARVSLLDSRKGACEFMDGYIAFSGLSGVRVIQARAEEAAHDPELRETFSLVTSRAVASPHICLEISTGFLAIGGKAVLWLGPEQEISQSEDVLKRLGLRYVGERKYKLSPDMGERALAVYSKEFALQDDIPRNYARIKRSLQKAKR